MRRVFFLMAMFFSLNASADFFWLSGGVGQGSFSDISPNAANDMEDAKAHSYFIDWEGAPVVPLLLVHYGYRNSTATDFKMRFDNSATPRKADFKFSTHELGFKFNIPTRRVDVYFGAGGSWGQATLEDQEGQLSGEKRGLLGSYWQAGINYFFSPHVGLKLTYQKNYIRTYEMKNLNDKNLKFDNNIISLGLVIFWSDGNDVSRRVMDKGISAAFD